MAVEAVHPTTSGEVEVLVLNEDEIVEISRRSGGTWSTSLRTVVASDPMDVARAAQRGARSLLWRDLLNADVEAVGEELQKVQVVCAKSPSMFMSVVGDRLEVDSAATWMYFWLLDQAEAMVGISDATGTFCFIPADAQGVARFGLIALQGVVGV